MRTAESFFNWAFKTRANTVARLCNHEEMSPEKIFLSFCSHDPAFISHGPEGLNASIKGIGFMPKREYLEETLEAYQKHIASYVPGDKTYSQRGLELLMKYMYAPEVQDRVDFTCVGSLEMAMNHSWKNYQVNPEATLLFYQPPAISYELRGKMEIIDGPAAGDREIYQRFINAQHDVYHFPNLEKPVRYPAYIFHIEEVFDNSATPVGFGTKLQYPYENP